jgi:hypothetical protein
MSIGDEGDVTDGLVLRIWQLINLLGDARERSGEIEESGFTFILARVEKTLLDIVSEVAKLASKLKDQPRQKVSFRKSAHGALSSPAIGCSTHSRPSSPAERVANALSAPECPRRKSLSCASACASATSEAAGSEPLSERLYLNPDGSSRSAAIDDGDASAITGSSDQIVDAGPNSISLKNDDPLPPTEAPVGSRAESRPRLTKRRGMSIGLTGRVVLLVIMAVSPVLGTQVWNEYDLRIAREADIRQKVVQTTKQLGEEIGELREGARQMLLAIAQLDPVKSHQSDSCIALLSKLKHRFPNYDLIGAADTDGRVYCSSASTPYSSVADQQFFARAMANPGPVVGNYSADPTTGQRMIHFAERFDDSDGYIAGVVFAGLDLAWLSDHLKEHGWSPRTSILIADREGNIIVRLPHPETLVGKNMRKSHERIMDGDEAGWEEATGVDGVTRIFGYVPAALPPKDFFLSAGQSKAEAFAPIDRSTWRGIGLILAGFSTAICIAWVGARNFARQPVRDMLRHSGERRASPDNAGAHLKSRASQTGSVLLALDGVADAFVTPRVAQRAEENSRVNARAECQNGKRSNERRAAGLLG